MTNLNSLPSKILSSSKLIAVILISTILVSACSSKETDSTLNNKSGSKSTGVVGSIFWAPTVEISGTIYKPAYYFFYSEDSCFIMYGGTTNGFTKAYTKNESSVTIKFGTDKGDIRYRLLGNQVLMDNARSFYRVESFSDAFQGNR